MVYKKVIGFLLLIVMISATVLSFAKQNSRTTSAVLTQSSEWLYDDNAADPTDPENYTLHTDPEGLSDICEQVTGICGIIAPVDPSSSPSDPKPLIDEELEERIENQDMSNNDVFRLPKSN